MSETFNVPTSAEVRDGLRTRVAELETALAASQAREEAYRKDLVKLSVEHATMTMDLCEAKRKAEVLAAEVRESRRISFEKATAYNMVKQSDVDALLAARAATDAAGALYT